MKFHYFHNLNPRAAAAVTAACLMAIYLLSACQSAPQRTLPDAKVPYGARLAVIDFRDCLIQTEFNCDHSGEKVAPLIVSGLDDAPVLHAVRLARPVGRKDTLSDASATAYGKSAGYEFVVNGEVMDFHVPDSVIRDEHRGYVSMHVLRTSDGQRVESYRCDVRFGVVGSLDGLIEGVGADMGHELAGDASWIRHAVFGTPCDGPRHPEDD